MRKEICCRKEAQAAAAKAAEAEEAKNKDPHSSENRPQRTHDDLMKDMERLKNALGIDSSIIEQYFMKLIKYKTLCGNLSTQEGRWTITTLICLTL
jgi:hypothetical protein